MKSLIHCLGIVLVSIAIMLGNVQKTFAKEQIIETSGSYVMDSRLDETPATATARAREEAKRNAIEMAGTFIQSYSKMIDLVLEQDEVTTVAAQLIKVLEEKSSIKVIQDNLLEFTVHIKAVVDDSNEEMLKSIMSDKQKLEDMIERNKELQKEYDNLKSQMESLKQQYNSASDEQRAEIKKAAVQNNEYFKAAQELEKGNNLYLSGDYNNALEAYNLALNMNRELTSAYNNRGLTYYHLNQANNAISDFNKAIELNPSFTDAYNNRGLARQSVGNFDLALQDYTKAIQLNSKFVYAYNNRGNTFIALKQYQQAITDFQTALGLMPNYPELHNNLGNAYFSLKRYDDAISRFTKALQLNPQYADAYYNRSCVYYRLGRYADALNDAQRASLLNPNNSSYKDMINRVKAK